VLGSGGVWRRWRPLWSGWDGNLERWHHNQRQRLENYELPANKRCSPSDKLEGY
ncbi:hypothetical protein IRJ41_022609, partial [Triplophysa rosa]